MEGEEGKSIEAGKINYYWFSRCRYWDVLVIPQLAFNAPISEASKQGSELDRYFKAIRQGIESGQLTPQPRAKITRWSRGRAFFSIALQGWMADDSQFYRTRLLAGEVFRWSLIQHMQGFKWAPEFVEMEKEIYPFDFANQVFLLNAWSIPNIIRIIFGERYKEWPEGPERPIITKFLELITTDVSAGKLKLLHPLPSENINEWEFRPIEIIRFIASGSFEYWRQFNLVDILEWVSSMFEEIETVDPTPDIHTRC